MIKESLFPTRPKSFPSILLIIMLLPFQQAGLLLTWQFRIPNPQLLLLLSPVIPIPHREHESLKGRDRSTIPDGLLSRRIRVHDMHDTQAGYCGLDEREIAIAQSRQHAGQVPRLQHVICLNKV